MPLYRRLPKRGFNNLFSKKYTELLKPFDFYPSDLKFWQNGLSFISKLIDELEKLE